MTEDRREDPVFEKEDDAQIEAMLEQLGVEKAPASLSERLYRIPQEQGRKTWRWPWQRRASAFPRWAMAPALAAIPLLVISAVLMQPDRPSKAEVEQARHDLAVAFAYIDKAGLRVGDEIQHVLGEELRDSVKESLTENLPFTQTSHKEKST
jgi:hypothetical protein